MYVRYTSAETEVCEQRSSLRSLLLVDSKSACDSDLRHRHRQAMSTLKSATSPASGSFHQLVKELGPIIRDLSIASTVTISRVLPRRAKIRVEGRGRGVN